VSDVLQAIRHLHLMGTVTMDIIPPEFALRGSYRHLVTPETNTTTSTSTSTSQPSSPTQITNASSPKDQKEEEEEEEEDDKPNTNHTLPLYHPSFANSILPSTSMSPSWYSASTQKNSFAKWMSPSFYYSRPATSVILPSHQLVNNSSDESVNMNPSTSSSKGSFIPRDIVTRCLEYRIRRYSPKITPQRMRHVLQRFLKNMVLKANEET
jgi:hypothetical protein